MTAIDERALAAACIAFANETGMPRDRNEDELIRLAITAYLQALRPGSTGETEGWQPIETAPKDGTEILVCGLDTNGGTYRDVQRWPENWSLKWPVTYMAYAAGEPTHWRPLPEPPSAMLAAAGGRDE